MIEFPVAFISVTETQDSGHGCLHVEGNPHIWGSLLYTYLHLWSGADDEVSG